MTEVVRSGTTTDAGLQGTLFQGIKFWISQKVPQRARFIDDVKANGGEVLPLEKQADVKIVDHARKEALPGTHSYTFIEKSLRNGDLEDLEDHRVGASEGTVRSVGSIMQPAKGTRNKYTEADDRILWDWVQKNPQKGGGTDGNEIYKQLETKHPQHPWQSWRDRFIKHLKGKPRPYSRPYNAPPTPPSDTPTTTEPPKETQAIFKNKEANPDGFEEEEAETLMEWGEDILNVQPGREEDAWKAWTNGVDKEHRHSASQWQAFWEERVLPRYLKRNAKQANQSATEQPAVSRSATPKPSAKPAGPSQFALSPFAQKSSNIRDIPNSPSYHPELPSMQLTGHSTGSPTTRANQSSTEIRGPAVRKLPKRSTPLKMSPSAEGQNLKRKHGPLEEEILSSSPPETALPLKRSRLNGLELPREIESTPQSSPSNPAKQQPSPVFIEIDDDSEEDASDNEEDDDEDYGPLGQEPSDTLSEPDRAVQDTQAILKADTQSIDFDVHPPDESWDEEEAEEEPENEHHTQSIEIEVPPSEGGWDDKDSGDEAFESESGSTSTVTEIYDPRPEVPETQAILHRQTQTPESAVADPDESWENLIPSSPPPMPDSPRARSEDPEIKDRWRASSQHSDIEAQTDAWIDAHVTKGFPEEQVELALHSTSMDTSLAEEVLKHLARKGGIPKNRRGVWTETDDRAMRSTDAREIHRLEEKHGADCLDARWDFLSFMDQLQEQML